MNLKEIRIKIFELLHYFKFSIWQIEARKLKGVAALKLKTVRVIVLTVRGFTEDKISLQASALTFLSLLSVVPVIAMAFGISKGFGLEKLLEERVHEAFAGQEIVAEQIMTYARSMLEGTKGGMIAGIGLLILLWTIMKLFNNIETTFNEVWQIKKARTFERKFTDYMSIMIFAPILVILSGSVNVFITTQIENITQSIELLELFSPLILFMLKFLPYTLIWLLLTLLYLIMPNTKVKVKAAIIAGVISGTIYQITQWAYITFQVGAARYGTIYGSLAALPLFLIWLQLSWLIILIGAEISYAVQHDTDYEHSDIVDKTSLSLRRKLALFVVNKIVEAFRKGEEPPSEAKLSESLSVPLSYITHTTQRLLECKIINEVLNRNTENKCLVPAIDIDKLTIDYVIKKLDNFGEESTFNIPETKANKEIINALNNFDKTIEAMPDNKKFKNLDQMEDERDK